ncbi:hypothetical protein [Kiloniella sp. b19]|uniref:hypothetical protein n=1 Tax=Kiloniella sp. GXU_MW_B19 TaxID=3141326 RepID=UPI0031E16743
MQSLPILPAQTLKHLTGGLVSLALVCGLAFQAKASVNPGQIKPSLADPLAGALSHEAELCRSAIDQVERDNKIPLYLLRAISLVESGKWDAKSKSRQAWPWTVMAEGKGRYLPNKAAAIAEVKKLKAKGVRNIDVGCMQVNLHYHPDAFANLEEAFDPYANARYAGNFLLNLRKEMRSWTMAVGRYHSATPKYAGPYRHKAIKAWRGLQQDANRQRQEIMQVEAEERRAALKARQEAQKQKTTETGNRIKPQAHPSLALARSAHNPVRPSRETAAISFETENALIGKAEVDGELLTVAENHDVTPQPIYRKTISVRTLFGH